MKAEKIIDQISALTIKEFRQVAQAVAEISKLYEQWQSEEPTEQPERKTYRQEYTKCSKPTCQKCATGKGHGPYWYAYWREKGKLRKVYIGKERKEL